jgi:hypothetical protein
VLAAPVLAGDISGLRINGFATIAMSTLDEPGAMIQGVGDERRFDADSILGLQFRLPINERVNFTTQILGKGGEDYRANVEWAFFTLEANEYFDVRAGRLRIPFFSISDSLEIGYAYPWVRPPVDVYGQLGFSRFDGADLIYRTALGGNAFSAQAYTGSSSPVQELMGMEVELDIVDLWGLNLQLQNDYLQLRIGHTEGDYSIGGVDAMMASVSFPAGMNVPETLMTSGRHGEFTGVGLSLFYQDVQLLSEYTRRKTDGMISDSSGWYTTLTYQLDDWQPHITFSKLKTDEDYRDLEDMAAMLSGTADASMQSMAGMLNSVIRMGKVDQDSVTLGVRYDWMPRMAVKLEWQQIQPEKGSNGLFDAAHTIEDKVSVYTIAIDSTF